MALNKIVATELFTAWLDIVGLGQRWFSKTMEQKNVQKENITVRSRNLDLIDIPIYHPMDLPDAKD